MMPMPSVGVPEMDAVAALLELRCEYRGPYVDDRQKCNQPQREFVTKIESTDTAVLSMRRLNLSLDVTRVTASSTPKHPSPGPSSPTVVKLANGGYIIRNNGNNLSPSSPRYRNVAPMNRKRVSLHKKYQEEQKRWAKESKAKMVASEVVKRTCTVGTQTEIEYQMPQVEKLEAFIKELCNRINVLERQLEQASSNVKLEQNGNKNILNGDYAYDIPVQARQKYVRRAKTNSGSLTMPSEEDTDDDSEYKVDEEEINEDLEMSEEDTISEKDDSNKVIKTETNTTDMVPIGDGNAIVPSRVLRQLDWTSYTSATRKLLTAVFSRKVLATHSLTGKPSPAFPDKPAKKKLDAALVNDIVQTVVERCKVPENVVRTSITTKCADESKMFRCREQNKMKRRLSKKENLPPRASSSPHSTSA